MEKHSRPLGGYPAPTAMTFTGRLISLAPMDVTNDLDELFACSHESDSAAALWRYLPAGPFSSPAEMGDWLRRWQALPDAIPFTVTDNATGRRVGTISLMRITPAHGVAELGCIWYAPGAQRTKANTEANFLLLDYGFTRLGYRRMEWKCDAENARSRAAALRLGYTFEGIFRQHLVVKGLNRDTAWFAMLDHEWSRIGAAMRRWLYEDDSVSLGELTRGS